MTRDLTPLLTSLFAAALFGGCLADAPMADDDASADAQDTASDTNPANDSSSGSDTSTGPDDTYAGPATALCPSLEEAPDALLLAFANPGAAVTVDAEGRRTQLEEATATVPEGFDDDLWIDVRASEVGLAVNASWGGWNDEDAGSAVSFFASDGALLWQREWPSDRTSIDAVGVDGSVLVSRVPASSVYVPSERFLLLPDGGELPLPADFYPQGGRLSHGLLPGSLGKEVGWLDPATGAFTIVGLDPMVIDAHDRMIARSLDAPGTLVVSAPGQADAQIALPGTTDEVLRLIGGTGDWLMVSDGWEQTGVRHFRVDLRTLEVVEIAPLIDGYRAMELCWGDNAVVDAGGRVAIVRRNDAEARVFRSTDASLTAWEPVGRPMTEIVTAQLEVAGETVILSSMGLNETYCPNLEWTAEAASGDAFVGGAVQIVSPNGSASPVVGARGWHTLQPSSDGLCVVYSDPTQPAGDPANHLQVLDVPTGELATVDARAAWVQWLR